jgi:hypothetical protein
MSKNAPRSVTNRRSVTTLVCEKGHEHTVQPWGKPPTRCMALSCKRPLRPLRRTREEMADAS